MVPYHGFIVVVPEIGAVTTIDKMNTILAQRHGKDCQPKGPQCVAGPLPCQSFWLSHLICLRNSKKALVSLFFEDQLI